MSVDPKLVEQILARRRGIAMRQAGAIKDVEPGAPMFYIDGTKLRDINGKIVGGRVSSDAEALKLSDAGARLMRGEDVGSGEQWPMSSEVRKSKSDGKLVTMDLGPGDVASGTAARAAFLPIPPQDYIADQVSPVCMVSHDRGSWWLENVADSIQQVLGATGSAAGGPAEISPGFTNTQFVAPLYGLRCRVPSAVMGNADFDLQLVALRRVTEGLRLLREIRVATQLLASGSWASANIIALGSTAKWNGGSTADPLAAIFAASAASSLRPTTIVMSEAVEPYFFSNTGTAGTNRVQQFTQAGGVLPNVLVGRARKMVSGAASFVWGTSAPISALLIREVADPRTEIGTARTLRWCGEAPDGQITDGVLVRRFREGNPINGNDFVVAVHADIEVMVSNQVGALLTGAVQ